MNHLRYPIFSALLASVAVTFAADDVSNELILQSHRQQSVGHSLQDTVLDLNDLLSDLASNGLAEADSGNAVNSLETVLDDLGDDQVPEVLKALREAAGNKDVRNTELNRAQGGIDVILDRLDLVLTQIGDKQRTAAVEAILNDLVSDSQDLMSETQEWAEKQVNTPDTAEQAKQEVESKQAELASKVDALMEFLEEQTTPETDPQTGDPTEPEAEDPLQDVLDALAPEDDTPQDGQPETTETPEDSSDEDNDTDSGTPASEDVEQDVENIEEALNEDNASAALEAQKSLLEKLQEALAEVGGDTPSTDETDHEGSTEDTETASSENSAAPPEATDPTGTEPEQNAGNESSDENTSDSAEIELADLAPVEAQFGEDAGSEFSDADLEALLGGEKENDTTSAAGGEAEEGEQTGNDGIPPPGMASDQQGQKGLTATENAAPGGMGNSQNGNKPSDKQQQPPTPAQVAGTPTPGGGSKSNGGNQASAPSNVPTAGVGDSGSSEGAASSSMNQPHGTHYESTAKAPGGGKSEGAYVVDGAQAKSLAMTARKAISQDYELNLPPEYRAMAAEYFELLGSVRE